MDINSFDQLIEPFLKDGRKYVSHQCRNLLSIGENYGSVMLDVKVNLEKHGQEETEYCVAKTTPVSEVIWKIFNTPVTFKKEIALYKQIVPALIQFGKEKGIENIMPFFAKCVGARISLDPTATKADKDAVLLLENIKVRGFTIVDRCMGFSMEETKLILKDLAIFHAVPLAYKLEKPEEFERRILPHLRRDYIFIPDEDMVNKFMTSAKAKVSANPKVASLYPKIEETTRRTLKLLQQPPVFNKLYATMTHNDYWVNNTMLKHENGNPVENKMVDFQNIEYNSLALDLVFFLYSSVQVEVLEHNVDYFVEYYFDIFINTLRRLGCDTEQFTYESFLEDMNLNAKNYQVNHVIMMLQPIYTKKGEAKDLATVQSEEDIIVDESSLHENFAKRLYFILLDFEKRGWL